MVEILDWIKLLAIALAVSLVVRFFVFIPVLVDGSSMVPTLLNTR
jgi:signal peptidase I